MLTPFDVETREFLVALQGYERDTVRDFLREVAEQIDQMRAEIEQLRALAARPTVTEGRVQQPGVDHTTQRILEAARKAGAEIIDQARSVAEAELAEGRTHAAEVLAEGQRRRAVIDGATDALTRRRLALAGDLHTVARILAEVLAELHRDHEVPDPEQMARIATITPPHPVRSAPTASATDSGTPVRQRGRAASNSA